MISGHSLKSFHICTLSNRPEQYRQMKDSFLAAGFDETRCTYTLLDNSSGNRHEPYSAFNQIKARCTARYLIFCHQDVLLSEGDGYEKLLQVITEIEARDPRWGLLGNAGINRSYRYTVRITDPHWTAGARTPDLPQRVTTLDENFLVINPRADVNCSPDLSGFHFYGPDLCLNARKNGHAAYVVDFHLRHLSSGKLDASFWAMRDQFQSRWQNHFHCVVLKTVTGIHICLSKHRPIRAFFASRPVATKLLRPKVERVMTFLRLPPR